MVIKMTIHGTKRFERILTQLPRELNKALSDSSGEWMRNVVKSAKLRAPRDTEKLKESIKLIRIKNGWLLDVQSPHGIYQEEGFKAHWVHTDMMEGSKSSGQKGFVWVKKSTPFVAPALEHNLSRLSTVLQKATKDGISKSR